MKIETVVFDMDGTILNTLEDITDSLNHVLISKNLPIRSLAETRQMVGNGIPTLVRRAVPEGTDEALIAECIKEMLRYYALHCNEKTAPYAGILALLKELRERKIKTAVVTNKAETAAILLGKEKFKGYLSVVIGAREGLRFKPAPDGVLTALRELNADPKTAVYVGDSDVDMQTAQNAALPAIGVLWGFRDREVLAPYHPYAMVETVSELRSLLLGK